jgi:hypothetical protein
MAHGGVQLQVVVGYSNKNVPVIGGLLPPNGPAILAALTSNPRHSTWMGMVGPSIKPVLMSWD